MHVEAYRGAVILARSVIEATARDKGMTTGNLMAKIDAMYEARLIREDIKDGAHEVRLLANDAAHGDFGEPVPQTDAKLILTLMDEVLEEVTRARPESPAGGQLALIGALRPDLADTGVRWGRHALRLADGDWYRAPGWGRARVPVCPRP